MRVDISILGMGQDRGGLFEPALSSIEYSQVSI